MHLYHIPAYNSHNGEYYLLGISFSKHDGCRYCNVHLVFCNWMLVLGPKLYIPEVSDDHK